MSDPEELGSDIDRALIHGVAADRTTPLRPNESIAVARWVGRDAAAVVEVSFDPEADPGCEYDAVIWTYRRSPTGEWDSTGGPGSDFPMTTAGERPAFSHNAYPVEGMSLTTWGDDGVFTFGVAAEGVAAVEIRGKNGELTRADVGVFGTVVIATEHPPADVVALDDGGNELPGTWHLLVPDDPWLGGLKVLRIGREGRTGGHRRAWSGSLPGEQSSSPF